MLVLIYSVNRKKTTVSQQNLGPRTSSDQITNPIVPHKCRSNAKLQFHNLEITGKIARNYNQKTVSTEPIN